MATRTQHQTYDAELILKDSGAVTASAAAQVDGAAAYVDLGNDTESHGNLIVDVSALDTATGDEACTVVLQGSPDTAFTAATSTELVHLHLGASGTKLTDTNRTDTVGRYVVPFTNEQNGTLYRYVRLYTVAAGTTPSITYSAYLAPAEL